MEYKISESSESSDSCSSGIDELYHLSSENETPFVDDVYKSTNNLILIFFSKAYELNDDIKKLVDIYTFNDIPNNSMKSNYNFQICKFLILQDEMNQVDICDDVGTVTKILDVAIIKAVKDEINNNILMLGNIITSKIENNKTRT